MRTRSMQFAVFALGAAVFCFAAGAAPAFAQATSSIQGPIKITLDEAIQMALRTTTLCWRRAPRFSRARPRRSPRTCGRIRCCWATRSSCRSSTGISSIRTTSTIGAVRSGRQLSVRAREEAAAPAAGGEGPDGGDALAGGGQRAQAHVSGGVGIHQRRAGRIDARPGAAGPEKLSEHGGHQPGALQGGRHQRRRLPEDQAADAAVSDGRVAGAAGAGAGALGSAAAAGIRIGARGLRRGRDRSTTSR